MSSPSLAFSTNAKKLLSKLYFKKFHEKRLKKLKSVCILKYVTILVAWLLYIILLLICILNCFGQGRKGHYYEKFDNKGLVNSDLTTIPAVSTSLVSLTPICFPELFPITA